MTRIEKLSNLLPEDVDCALITSDINRRYFTQMKSSAGTVVVFKNEAYLIIDFRYFEKASECVKDCKVIEQRNLYEQLNELIKKHSAKTMAIESKSMTVYELSKINEEIRINKIDDSDRLSEIIIDLRAVKTENEIEKIVKAQRIAEKAFEEVLNFIKVGKTEKEVGFFLDSYMLTHGAEDLSFETIAITGSTTSRPHGVPSDKKIMSGEFVLMDYGAVCEGYHSDMTRTVCVGKPTEEMEKVYNIVLKAQNEGIKVAKAGMTGYELDKISRDIIENEGYGKEFGHSLGHGVGMEIHEFPNASPKCNAVLRENEVITIEPGIYLAGKFGVRIEDFGIITKSGFKDITKSRKELICL